MQFVLAALFFFAILTLWTPAYWPVTVFQVGLFGLAALAAVRAARSSVRLSYPLFPLAFAVAWGAYQWKTGRTVYSFETQNDIVQWATYLAACWTGFVIFQDQSTGRWFRTAMIWFSLLVAALATVQSFTAAGKVFWLFPTGYTEYVMGPIVYRNHYAVFIEVVLPMALYRGLGPGRRPGRYCVIAAALYASVIASASRTGSILVTGEVALVAGILWTRCRSVSRALGVTYLHMAFLLVALTAVVGWQRLWDRFWQADPMAWRREFAISSIHMIWDHPWFGTGLGTWATVYPRYAIADFGVFANRAHSDWLQWTVEGGLPLTLAMLTLFIWCLRPAFRSVWGLGVVAVFLHAAVDYPFSRPALGSWLFVLVAMLAAKPKSESSNAPGRDNVVMETHVAQ